MVSVSEGESLADTAFGKFAKVPQNGSAEMEDDPELALALKMSLEENQQATKTESEPMETEEDELAKAIAMSLSNLPDKSEKQQIDKLIGDKDFLSNLCLTSTKTTLISTKL
ncbi:hypothetical protein MHBO_003068 [Bonamia ostreae]|uniref:Uncharacterized protein n=1 Tax=Bonamia ostreae TaxID=126728 RepID=A0ABV2APE4_9EUKA